MLRFSTLDVLKRALAQEVVPPTVSAAAAQAGFDTDGRIWLDTAVPLSGAARSALRLLDVDLAPKGTVPPLEPMLCWHQLIDIHPETVDRPLPIAQTPVLFELPDLSLWPRLAGDIVRQSQGGPTRTAWRETGDGRLLLRVVGPPYISLLRAREGDEATPFLRAYVEQAPRVWIEVGRTHTLLAQLLAPPGQLLLLRRFRCWSLLPDAPFQSEAEVFPVGGPAAPGREVYPERRLTVSPRLRRDRPDDAAELWVLRDRPLEQLADLLRDSGDELLALLSVAVARREGLPLVVLRVRPVPHETPTLVLHGEGYRPWLKMPNLFVPVGRRLQPLLRRDVVRRLLTDEPQHITWLRPLADGSFIPESVAESAFAPLPDQLEYVQAHAAQALTPWTQTTAFEGEPFVTRADEPPVSWRSQLAINFRSQLGMQTMGEPAISRERAWRECLVQWFRSLIARWWSPRPRDMQPQPSEAAPSQPGMRAPEPMSLTTARRDPLAEAVQRFLQPTAAARAQRMVAEVAPPARTNRSIEDEFLNVAGPLDAPERRNLWPKLAGLYQAEGSPKEAAVCWLHALWETDEPLWLWGWFRAESRAAGWKDPPTDLGYALAAPQPNAADVRAVAAFAGWAARQPQPPPQLIAQLPAIRAYLEANEPLLPVRSAWLTWCSLSRHTGGDALTLARARDRLLERLFRQGLSLDQDFPGFLRCASQGAAGRSEPLRDWLLRQRGAIHHWIEALHHHLPPDPALQDPNVLATARLLDTRPPYGTAGEAYCTQAYADLTLAWGLAQLGAASDSWQLAKQADAVLAARDAVHRFLLEAYHYRVQQVLEGQPSAGSLPETLLAQLNGMPELDRYKIDWLRQQSRILEPYEKIDPARGLVQRDYFDELNPILARLPEIGDRAALRQRLEQLLTEAATAEQFRAALPRVLKAALEQAPRIDEAFAVDVLHRVAAMLDEQPATLAAAPLMEKALAVAAHFEQTAYVHQFITRFQHLLDRRHGPEAARAFASLADQSFRGLRRLGLRQEIDRLLKQMADALLQGHDLASLRARLGINLVGVLPTLLHVAGVWFYEGDDARAVAVLDEVRSLLFSLRLPAADQARLARAYVAGLGHAPPELALGRLEELFRKLDHVNDALSTKSHFSLAQLGVIEAMVAAVVDANFALGMLVRRWLDEDEYLVRRRIHRDVRAIMSDRV